MSWSLFWALILIFNRQNNLEISKFFQIHQQSLNHRLRAVVFLNHISVTKTLVQAVVFSEAIENFIHHGLVGLKINELLNLGGQFMAIDRSSWIFGKMDRVFVIDQSANCDQR